MGQAAYPITNEKRAMGVVFEEYFTNPSLCAKNGTVLVGSPAVNRGITLNGTTQYATNPKRLSLNGQGFVVLRFTPSFNYDENVNRYLLSCGGHWALANNLSILKFDVGSGSLALTVSLGGITISCAAATYGPRWLVGQENVLVVSLSGVTSKIWLNGYDVGGASAAMTLNNMSAITIGAKYDGNFKFAGSIQSLIIGNRPLTQGCEERLITPEPLSRIRTEASLVTISGVQTYNRASDGKRVTPLLGQIATRHGVREAILGDGTTATTFPTLLTPRGFSFDGGDYLILGDHDAFTFADDAGDKPFSVAVMFQIPTSGLYKLLGKFGIANKECMFQTYINGQIILRIFDQTDGGNKFIISAANSWRVGIQTVAIATFTNSTTMKLYINGVDVSGAITPAGVYTRMRNTIEPVMVGDTVAGYVSYMANGSLLQVPPRIFDVALSECEVRALTARLQRQARTR